MAKWRTVWLASAWLLVCAVIYFSLTRVELGSIPGNRDKIWHALAYAVMAFWFMQIYLTRASRAVSAAALVVLGIVLELLQGYTGYRQFEYADMIANAIGVAAGWIASPPRTPSVLARIERSFSR